MGPVNQALGLRALPAASGSRSLLLLLLVSLLMAVSPGFAVEDLETLAEDDPQLAVDRAATLAQEAELAGDTARLAELEFFRGRLLLDLERPVLARQAYERAASAFTELGNREGEMQARLGLGNALSDQEEYEEALGALYDAARLAGALGDVSAEARTHALIGQVHFFTGDVDTAYTYFSRARSGFGAIDDRGGYAQALNNLAVIARHRQELDTARALNEQSLEIRQSIGDISGMAASYNNLAVVAWLEGNLAETERQHKSALELYRQSGDTLGEARSLHNLGYTYLLMEDFDRAETYLADSLALIEEVDSNTLRQGHYRRMADLGVARGDYQAALEARTRQLEITEAMQTENRQRQIAELRALFEAERREQQIELLQQERQTQQVVRNALVAGAVSLVVILLLLWNRYLIRSRAGQAIAARNEQLDAMDRIVATLNTEEDFGRLLSAILEEALVFFEGADRGAFLVRSREDDRFRPAVWRGYRSGGMDSIVLTGVQARRRYQDGAEQLAEGVCLHHRPEAIDGHERLHQEDPTQAMLAMAITVDGSTDGYLILQSARSGNAFTTANREIYSRFREHAISAFSRARHLEQLAEEKERAEQAHIAMERLARKDSLTELPNRRHMQEKLEEESVRSQRSGRASSVIICDIDHFKDINDRLGHEAGDRILKHVAGLLTQRLRAQDMVARWGGEEFLVLLPETGLDGGRTAAESLRVLVAEQPAHYDGESVAVTMTFGVACHQPGQESMESTIRRADEVLYQGKEGGRNRVEVADAGPGTHRSSPGGE